MPARLIVALCLVATALTTIPVGGRPATGGGAVLDRHPEDQGRAVRHPGVRRGRHRRQCCRPGHERGRDHRRRQASTVVGGDSRQGQIRHLTADQVRPRDAPSRGSFGREPGVHRCRRNHRPPQRTSEHDQRQAGGAATRRLHRSDGGVSRRRRGTGPSPGTRPHQRRRRHLLSRSQDRAHRRPRGLGEADRRQPAHAVCGPRQWRQSRSNGSPLSTRSFSSTSTPPFQVTDPC